MSRQRKAIEVAERSSLSKLNKSLTAQLDGLSIASLSELDAAVRCDSDWLVRPGDGINEGKLKNLGTLPSLSNVEYYFKPRIRKKK